MIRCLMRHRPFSRAVQHFHSDVRHVVDHVAGEQLVEPVELPFVEQEAVQRERLADRPAVVSG